MPVHTDTATEDINDGRPSTQLAALEWRLLKLLLVVSKISFKAGKAQPEKMKICESLHLFSPRKSFQAQLTRQVVRCSNQKSTTRQFTPSHPTDTGIMKDI